MRSHHPGLAVAIALLLALTLLPSSDVLRPASSDGSAPADDAPTSREQAHGKASEKSREARTAERQRAVAVRSRDRGPDISAYRGHATWVDMYNDGPYERPADMVRRMAARGVRTIFLQTANYSRPHDPANRIYRQDAVSTIIEAAHRRNMRVVAWYLPSFKDLERDLNRSRDAIRFRSEHGHRFDGFALDIESPVVDSIAARNARYRTLTRRIERLVPRSYALGAIIPEAGASYSPNFPYRFTAQHYDVFLPMAYATFRTEGYKGTARFMASNIRAIRHLTGNADVPIHVIGGIAGHATDAEARAVVDVTLTHKAVGASLYDWPGTSRAASRALQRVQPPREAAVGAVKARPKNPKVSPPAGKGEPRDRGSNEGDRRRRNGPGRGEPAEGAPGPRPPRSHGADPVTVLPED